jgi:hypothetical protein
MSFHSASLFAAQFPELGLIAIRHEVDLLVMSNLIYHPLILPAGIKRMPILNYRMHVSWRKFATSSNAAEMRSGQTEFDQASHLFPPKKSGAQPEATNASNDYRC